MNYLQIEGYRKYLSRPFDGKQFLVYDVMLPTYNYEDKNNMVRMIASPCLQRYLEYLKGKILRITLPSGLLEKCRLDSGPLYSFEEPWGKCIITYFRFTVFHDNLDKSQFIF